MSMCSLTFCRRSSKSGLPSRCFRFAGEPVMKLSSVSTRMPRFSSASQRCDPMNPAPPETTARGLPPPALLAANAAVREAQAAHRGRDVDVAPVDHDRGAHRGLEPRQVELAELVPLGHHHERVGAGRELVRVLRILELGEDGPGPLHRGGVVAADIDRKSTRLNSSHSQISYAVFCLKKKKPVAPFDGTDTRIATNPFC